MSDDGFPDSFEEPNMEIQIKTLMGTTFEVKVSSNDTVGDIKKKIYRVEGIPVYQQNLIFQSEELKDTTRLCDSGIRSGSILTLVSAMRGGPISTRRLSVTCEHYLLKELKDLLENTRDELTPGSKVSVLVFKEGDIINLLRVIENEDGSYSPYNESPISPPSKPSRRDTLEAFERLVEDTEMCTKIATLRKKMEELNIKKQTRTKTLEDNNFTSAENAAESDKSVSDDETKENINFSYRFLEECAGELLDNVDLTIFEKSLDEDNQSESEEIALKDKHRTKPKGLQSLPVPKSSSRSLYSERKGTYSHTRQNYAKIAKRREPRLFEKAEKSPGGYTSYSRERYITGCQKSGLLDNKDTYPNRMPSLDALDDRLHSMLTSSSILEDDGVDRLSMPNDSSENPYLLEGLNSNKLPDLKIIDTDDFLTGGLDETRGILAGGIGNSPCAKNSSTFLNLPISSNIGSNTARISSSSRVLPDLTSRISNRSFGSLMPEIGSSNTASLEDRLSSSSTLINTLPLANTYPLPSIGKLSQTHSVESSKFSNVQMSTSYSSALPQTSTYSLASTNKPSQSRNTLDTSLPNLTRLETLGNISSSRGDSPILGAAGPTSVEEFGAQIAEQLHLLDDDSDSDVFGESLTVAARNRVHLTRLVLASEVAERPKSSPDSIELEERTQDVWEIHEPASERLKHSATCKVGLLKRRQGVEYNYDSLENSQSNIKPELGNLGNYSKSSTEFGVCSGTNFYMPQYLSAPSAIPPQYAPKHHPKYCDFFFRNEPRSPLYSRRNRKENLEFKKEIFNKCSANFEGDCSRIQRLKNDENLFGSKEEFNNEDLFGYYNLGCAADLLEKVEETREVMKLPPVIKKRSRCNECNKRLNITNIYNCRCGRIFCSQHRYSEVHRCTYDYKTEGRKVLEQQNPLVTAEKVQRF